MIEGLISIIITYLIGYVVIWIPLVMYGDYRREQRMREYRRYTTTHNNKEGQDNAC